MSGQRGFRPPLPAWDKDLGRWGLLKNSFKGTSRSSPVVLPISTEVSSLNPSKMSSSLPLPAFSNADVEDLHFIEKLLHVMFHRNHNQHRRSVWWKHFAGFRRGLSHLLRDQESVEMLRVTKRGKKLKEDLDKVDQKMRERIGLWKDVYVEKWWISYEVMAEEQVHEVLCQFAAEEWAGMVELGTPTRREDLGEAVERSSFGPSSIGARRSKSRSESMGVTDSHSERMAVTDSSSGNDFLGRSTKHDVSMGNPASHAAKRSHGPESSTESSTEAKPPKKKRKKANAIDELFSGLL
ncbi:RNase MRP subunit [Cryomyces antarcticus]|uniref:RNase MRP subunit n=1 Tax=Cryomyces antarcticus TaxID=329879 RepID=A0ABR0MB53_9PEZI|nr:Ribonuclease MRP protein subunit rmp1 [Cryomyces antarcticus]KAK5020241.1 Ribonuclease MRP protein subunit rmp1 [Cryomyces antarcticus]KAK5295700.1 RNase MRP subunit [Cryomyces antarcticus]